MAGGTSGSHQSVIYSGMSYILIDNFDKFTAITDEFSYDLITEYRCYTYDCLVKPNCQGHSGNRRISQARAEAAAGTKTQKIRIRERIENVAIQTTSRKYTTF